MTTGGQSCPLQNGDSAMRYVIKTGSYRGYLIAYNLTTMEMCNFARALWTLAERMRELKVAA